MPWLKRDEVSLNYEDAGDDGPPIVLVRGWGCDHTFMAPQFTHFRKAHRLASVGLLDTTVLPAPGVWAGVQPVLAGLHALDYRDVVSEFFAQSFFLPTDGPERKAWPIEAMLKTPQHVLASALEGIFRLGLGRGDCQVPGADPLRCVHAPTRRRGPCRTGVPAAGARPSRQFRSFYPTGGS